MSNLFSPPPLRTPIMDKDGIMMVAWQTWFAQIAATKGVTTELSYLKSPSGVGTITIQNGIVTAVT